VKIAPLSMCRRRLPCFSMSP